MAAFEVVTFSVSGQVYAVEIVSIEEIIPLLEVEKVPKGPEFLEGLINLRGEIIPVVNLEAQLGYGRKPDTAETRILISKCGGRKIGILVNGVREIISLDRESLKPAIEDQAKASAICGAAQMTTGQIVQIITIDKILEETSIQQLAQMDLKTNAQ